MTMTNPSRLAREITEMADAQRALGIIDEAAYEKIMARPLGEKAPPIAARDRGQSEETCFPASM